MGQRERSARYNATDRAKAVRSVAQKRWRARPDVKAKTAAKYQEQRAIFLAFTDGLKNVPCMDCGGRFPPECMDFDHVRGEKRFQISKCSNKSLRLVAEEVAKCDVVCANCHRIRTKQRRRLV